MAYKVSISPRCQIEIENAIDFYSIENINIPKHFIQSLNSAYQSLSVNPFYEIRYKDIRSLRLSKFPYSLFFVVLEDKKIVKILACFHHKLNPKKRP